MIVNTQRLFSKLLALMRIGVVCDVGSMDGAEALRFRKVLPKASVYAFEPNPMNFSRMDSNPALKVPGIRIEPMAVTNHDGHADFFLVDADYDQLDYRRGMSSLYRRSAAWAPVDVVSVKATRLDTFLASRCGSDERVALWIDAEGKAHEAIEGIAGVAERVHLLHIEVETAPIIGSTQKLYAEVSALLRRWGFRELATDQPRSGSQFNALFIRSDLRHFLRCMVCARLLEAMVRRTLVRAIRRMCPACLRRYQAWRRS